MQKGRSASADTRCVRLAENGLRGGLNRTINRVSGILLQVMSLYFSPYAGITPAFASRLGAYQYEESVYNAAGSQESQGYQQASPLGTSPPLEAFYGWDGLEELPTGTVEKVRRGFTSASGGLPRSGSAAASTTPVEFLVPSTASSQKGPGNASKLYDYWQGSQESGQSAVREAEREANATLSYGVSNSVVYGALPTGPATGQEVSQSRLSRTGPGIEGAPTSALARMAKELRKQAMRRPGGVRHEEKPSIRKLPPVEGRGAMATAALLYLGGLMSSPWAFYLAALGLRRYMRSISKREETLFRAIAQERAQKELKRARNLVLDQEATQSSHTTYGEPLASNGLRTDAQ